MAGSWVFGLARGAWRGKCSGWVTAGWMDANLILAPVVRFFPVAGMQQEQQCPPPPPRLFVERLGGNKSTAAAPLRQPSSSKPLLSLRVSNSATDDDIGDREGEGRVCGAD